MIQKAWKDKQARKPDRNRRTGVRFSAVDREVAEAKKSVRHSREQEAEDAKANKEKTKLFQAVQYSLENQQSLLATANLVKPGMLVGARSSHWC